MTENRMHMSIPEACGARIQPEIILYTSDELLKQMGCFWN